MNNKLTKVETLSYSQLKETMVNLIKKLGYSDIQENEGTIVASNSSPLSSEMFLFILFKQKLSGSVNLEDIKDSILAYHQKYIANVIYIISQHHISSGFENSISKLIPQFKLHFIGRDRLITLIDNHYPDFWKHEDLNLIEYEKQFCSQSIKDTDLKKLKIFNDKYQKLLDIYIEPRLFHFYEDKATQTPIRRRVLIEDVIKDSSQIIISGDAGTGKSTFLKKIGETLISRNIDEKNRRNIPIFLTVTEIFEAEYKIKELIHNKINIYFKQIKSEDFFQMYAITILIDSIDELEDDKQKIILQDLFDLSEKYKVKYIVGTRNSEKLISFGEKKTFNTYTIEKFNTEQVRRFISNFFLGEKIKADNLIEALKENRIIEKLPITPLTLSLISILYEENNLEIPATIADIYDNFNSLIIGRATVSSRIEFMDISFKERILSLYALHLLERSQHTPLLKDEFFEYFTKYFEGKTLPIKKGLLIDVLNYLIDNTGVLILKENKWVQFSHDSYMEYYGAVEIFKHQREKEELLIDNFFEANWQNTAVFYAGKSKDLPLFLKKLIEKFKNANLLSHYFSGVLGCGYVLQALYQTDNQLRKTAVLEALDMNSKAADIIIKLAGDDILLFKNYSIPIIQLMNLMYFYETFNSVTIKEPLKLAFQETFQLFEESGEPINGLKSIQLAITLDSKRINESEQLSRLIETKGIFKIPLLYTILDFSFGLFNTEKYKKIKNEIRKEYFPKLKEPVKKLIELPASRIRFTHLDTQLSNKKVQLIVEGKTDAEILEHAYYVLTNGHDHYWRISVAGNGDSGGASEVAKAILNCKPIIDKDMVVIGLFDHDAKGLQEFRGLKDTIFEKYSKDTLRKHKECNVYGVVIPVPGEMDNYLKKDQQFNFFEIEHYFGFDFLSQNGMLDNTEIPAIYKIKESKKKEFSKIVRSCNDKRLFIYFIDLFKQIDNITNIEIEYS